MVSCLAAGGQLSLVNRFAENAGLSLFFHFGQLHNNLPESSDTFIHEGVNAMETQPEGDSQDESAATAGEDRGQAGQARPVLLADAGREPSHTAAVWRQGKANRRVDGCERVKLGGAERRSPEETIRMVRWTPESGTG